MLDPRGQLLRAAVGFAGCSLPSNDRSLLTLLRTWLDSWSGINRIAVGMHRQGFDLQLTQYDERGWRATFYTTGLEHPPTNARRCSRGRRRHYNHTLHCKLARGAVSCLDCGGRTST